MYQTVFLDLVLGEAAGRNFHRQIHLLRRLLRLGDQERMQHGIGCGHGTGQQQQGSTDGSERKDATGRGHMRFLTPSSGRHDPWRSARAGSRVA